MQPQAIQTLNDHFDASSKCAILKGITGTGKTLVMSHVIARANKPTLVLCHNKTLAAQLARELRAFLGSAELFISFYNHYRPESYKEATGTYVAKKSNINTDIDALRHRATRALLMQRHVGMPSDYIQASLNLNVGDAFEEDWPTALQHRMYTHVLTEDEFAPGTFQLLNLRSSSSSAADEPDMQQIILP